MANLRGGNFNKQAKDAFCRLAQFRQGRHGGTDHFTHSDGLAKKREMYLRDFKNFAEKNNLTGKLNIWMGDMDLMLQFFQERTDSLSLKTKKDYISGWNTMTKALRQANIAIDEGIDRAIDIMLYKIHQSRKELKNKNEYLDPINRAIDRKITFPLIELLADIEKINQACAAIAQLQLTFGFRTGEAFEIVKNPTKYIKKGKITGVKGQGGQYYSPKTISPYLLEKIQILYHKKIPLPSQNTYSKILKEVTGDSKIVPTDLRYTFIANRLEEKLAQNADYEQAVREVKEEACFYTKGKIWIQETQSF